MTEQEHPQFTVYADEAAIPRYQRAWVWGMVALAILLCGLAAGWLFGGAEKNHASSDPRSAIRYRGWRRLAGPARSDERATARTYRPIGASVDRRRLRASGAGNIDAGCSRTVSFLSFARGACMSTYSIDLAWRRTTPDFDYKTFDRGHIWYLAGGQTVRGSAAPDFSGDPRRVSPRKPC